MSDWFAISHGLMGVHKTKVCVFVYIYKIIYEWHIDYKLSISHNSSSFIIVQ